MTATRRPGLSISRFPLPRAALLSLTLVGVAAGGAWADDPPAVPPAAPETEEGGGGTGLQDLLPEEPPLSLDFEAFNILGPNWEAWSGETVEALNSLYRRDEPLDVPGQRAALATLRSRLRVMRRAIGEPPYAMIRDRLIGLHGRLARRVEMFEAILDTLALDPVAGRAKRAETARGPALAAAAALESYLDRISGGRAWLPYYRGAELRAALSDPARIDEAHEVAATALSRLEAKQLLEDETQRAFLSRPAFAALERELAKFVAAAAPLDPEQLAKLREALAALVVAVEDYEKSNLVGDATGFRRALGAVRQLAPDGGDRIELIVRRHYLNYNVVALVSEDLAARFVSDTQSRFAPVRDYGLGARIHGWQKTQATASFDLKPSDDGARFEVALDGRTHSNTVGVTDQASVQSIGNHVWRATKGGVFDGEHFITGKAYVAVKPSTTPVDASTDFDWVPILGSIARDMALEEARKRGPQARAFAAQRLMSRVGPDLDRQMEETFGRVTRDLQTKTFVRLKNAGLYSSMTKIQSTEDFARFSSRVGESEEPAGAVPEDAYPPGRGVTLHLHESFLNNAANRLGFNGRAMTERDVRKELGAYLSQLTGSDMDFLKDYKPKEETESLFLFDEKDPVRVQIDDGLVNLVLRTGLRKEGREDIPLHVVTVPLRVRIEDRNLVIEREGAVKAARVGGLNIGSSVVIRTRVEESFPRVEKERKLEIKRTDKPSIVLWVTRVKALDGWLSGWAE